MHAVAATVAKAVLMYAQKLGSCTSRPSLGEPVTLQPTTIDACSATGQDPTVNSELCWCCPEFGQVVVLVQKLCTSCEHNVQEA